jgi:hypothetical protein
VARGLPLRSGQPEARCDGVTDPAEGDLVRLDAGRVVCETRAWIEGVVIELELCPFAAEPLRAGLVRFAVSAASTPETLGEDLAEELRRLDREPAASLETTLLIHPRVLLDFGEYNRFLAATDWLLERLGLTGTLQVASFHPDYRFAGVPADDIANATNRSPFPMLHLLREESVARATARHPDPSQIPARNARRLRELGQDALAQLTPRGRPPA